MAFRRWATFARSNNVTFFSLSVPYKWDPPPFQFHAVIMSLFSLSPFLIKWDPPLLHTVIMSLSPFFKLFLPHKNPLFPSLPLSLFSLAFQRRSKSSIPQFATFTFFLIFPPRLKLPIRQFANGARNCSRRSLSTWLR